MAKQLKSTFGEQMLYAEREAMLLAILQNKDATLTDLYDFIGGMAADVPKGVTINDLLCGDIQQKKSPKISRRQNGNGSKRKTKAKIKVKTKANKELKVKKSKAKIDVRTQAGRDLLDTEIVNLLHDDKGKRWSSRELCKATGATNLQIRSAMGRLIEQGYATWEGQTNQMRYFAA